MGYRRCPSHRRQRSEAAAYFRGTQRSGLGRVHVRVRVIHGVLLGRESDARLVPLEEVISHLGSHVVRSGLGSGISQPVGRVAVCTPR